MSRGKYKSNIKEISEVGTVKVDSFLSSYEAGKGSGFMDGYESTEIPDIPGLKPDKSYIIRVNGESMSPIINHKDIVIIDTSFTKYRLGDVVAIYLNGDYLIKIYDPGSHCIYLASYNKEFEPIRVYEDDEFHILGKATMIVRNI